MDVLRTKAPIGVKRSASDRRLPCASFLSFIVLNLMMLNIFSFLPGRLWKKKGLPLLAMVRPSITRKKMGDNTNSPTRATRKSKIGLKMDLYILCVNFYSIIIDSTFRSQSNTLLSQCHTVYSSVKTQYAKYYLFTKLALY